MPCVGRREPRSCTLILGRGEGRPHKFWWAAVALTGRRRTPICQAQLATGSPAATPSRQHVLQGQPRMFAAIARKLFGSANDRVLRSIQPIVADINAAEADVAKLTDAELQARTPWLRERLAKGEALDDIL